MVKYSDDKSVAWIDGYKFTRDKRTGYYLSSKKIGGSRKRLHVYVYEKSHGKIKKGNHIHHIDGDKSNNEPSNLMQLTTVEHEKYHGSHQEKELKEFKAKNVVKNAMPKAAAWHKSEEGKKWHSEHAKMQAMRVPMKEKICQYCGKSFYTKKSDAKFCSNNCKAANRRKEGIDNVEKTCKKCGGKYIGDKYGGSKYCPVCRGRGNNGRWK